MFDVNTLHAIPPYALDKDEKQAMLGEAMACLTQRHYALCPEYARMLDALGVSPDDVKTPRDTPFLPVRLFKAHTLRSVPEEDVSKTMTSSGTTGQAVSRIYLDKETSAAQTKALSRIVTSWLGGKRLPMLIIDAASTVKDRRLFSARGAGILGFSMYGRDHTYALDENMALQPDVVKAFLEKHAGEELFLFGFTFMVWQHLYKALAEIGQRLDLSGATLIHGGGWKKLADEAVSAQDFRKKLKDVCGIGRVYDYYGMVEQTGSIYMECEHGHLHAPVYSDIIIRRPLDFSEAAVGEEGLIQTLSVLPGSYPGHSLLTEDTGTLLGEDDCPCGRFGKYFKVHGRLAQAELRGCSDTYAAG